MYRPHSEAISHVSFSKKQSVIMRKMRSIPAMFDVDFIVDGDTFPAHRGWVAAASPVLCTMLTNGMKESTQRKVVIKEGHAGTWKTMLDYIYFEEVGPQT